MIKDKLTSFVSVAIKALSNASKADSDGDGRLDKNDSNAFRYAKIKPFGTAEYESDVIYAAGNILSAQGVTLEHMPSYSDVLRDFRNHVFLSKLGEECIALMMKDVNECEDTSIVSDKNWLEFC